MAFGFLAGSSNGNNATKYFDIRLDNNYIVFRGGEDEAASAHVQGTLVLCLSESLTVKHLRLSLSGINRMSWTVASSAAMTGRKLAHRERSFYEQVWTFKDPGKNKTETLKPGNYEFPFDVVLDGSLPESVEGLDHSWVVYRFKAEIGRKYQKDIVVRKPLRIVRTLDSSALELSHAMSVENTWVDKIDYTISTPTKAVIFGTALQVDFRLVPLLKGLKMGTVSTQVKEEHEFVADAEFGMAACSTVQKFDRLIASDEYAIDTESDAQILDEEAEGYKFSRFLELPKSLNKCLQDCNVKGIKVRHKLKFNIQLHNPDGHVSELRANLPISLYISPALPINEDNDLVDQTPHAGRQAVANEVAQSAPPLYGQHQLDQLYSDVDATGYQTPGAFSTPGTPYSHSRNISSENLTSRDVATNSTGLSTSPSGQQINAAALQSRLQNLRGSVTNIRSPLAHEDRSPENLEPNAAAMLRRSSSQGDYFSQDSSGHHSHGQSPPNLQNGFASIPGSTDISRRTSDEGQPFASFPPSGAHTPRPQFFHAEDLVRVPSYATAVKTSAPRIAGGLPSYGETTAIPGPAEPQSAHLRDRPAQASRQMGAIQDEERRLQILRARGR